MFFISFRVSHGDSYGIGVQGQTPNHNFKVVLWGPVTSYITSKLFIAPSVNSVSMQRKKGNLPGEILICSGLIKFAERHVIIQAHKPRQKQLTETDQQCTWPKKKGRGVNVFNTLKLGTKTGTNKGKRHRGLD